MSSMPTTATHMLEDLAPEDLAEDLTRRLGIPFGPNAKGGVGFREPLRVTSWSVPLVFDGHAAWDNGSLVPTDFVGYALWASLRATAGGDDPRPWWHCTLSEDAGQAIVDHLTDDGAAGQGWVIGDDVPLKPTRAA